MRSHVLRQSRNHLKNCNMVSSILVFGLGIWEILIIVLVFLLLFGAKRIPELMKSLGKGVNSFKQGLKEVDEQINQSDEPADKSEKK